jgi:5-methyltetrahydrofolate--homocysteine methyltransferase
MTHNETPHIPDIIKQISGTLLSWNSGEAAILAQKALDQGINPSVILENAFLKPMEAVAGRFPVNLFAAHGLYMALPLLKAGIAYNPNKRALVCSVRGDPHSVAKNLVKLLLECDGFAVTDLGANCAPERILPAVKAAGKDAPVILCLSCLIPTALPAMQETVDGLNSGGARTLVKIIVGGALVTEDFARSIGADAYGPDVAAAVKLSRSFLV